jgi:hypothetical protein
VRVRVANACGVVGVLCPRPQSHYLYQLTSLILHFSSDFGLRFTSLFRARNRKARTARGPGAAYKFHVTTFLKRKCLTPEFSPRAGDRDEAETHIGPTPAQGDVCDT